MRRDAARSQTRRRRLGSVTLARSRGRFRAEYEFVSCRHHRIQRTGALRITGFAKTAKKNKRPSAQAAKRPRQEQNGQAAKTAAKRPIGQVAKWPSCQKAQQRAKRPLKRPSGQNGQTAKCQAAKRLNKEQNGQAAERPSGPAACKRPKRPGGQAARRSN